MTRHWAEMAERGAAWGLWVCATAYRLLGRHGCQIIIAPVVLYFYLTGTEQRRASTEFLTLALGRPPRWYEGYRQFLNFAMRAVDNLAAWTGRLPADHIQTAPDTDLPTLMNDPRGALLVISHTGNVEIARALLDPRLRARLTILVHTKHAEHYNRILAGVNPEATARFIQVTEMGPETAIALQERIERGDWIAIAGDRVPVGDTTRTARVDFFGRPAAFSHGPWILASLLQCPVHLMFCTRQKRGYSLSVERFADRIELPRRERNHLLATYATRYALRLEERARVAPFQWFNFFRYWA